MILIAGGTGVLGSAIARRLLEQRRPVRIMTRDASRGRQLHDLGAEIVNGDLRDRPSLDRAASGATHVITTANAFTGTRGADSVAAIDERGTRGLIDAAKDAGVQRFVFTSALLPESYRAIDYFAAKMANEEYVRRSGVPFTILRPTAFMETWANLVGKPLLENKTVPIFGSGRTPLNFVAVDDVAAIACMALDDPRALNDVVEIGGPENLTFLEVVATFERVTGKTSRRRHIPVPVMRLLSRVMRPFNPVLSRSIAAGALAATAPQPFDATAMLARYPVKLTTLEEWVRRKYGH